MIGTLLSGTPVTARRRDDERRSANGDANRIGADEQPGCRDIDAKVAMSGKSPTTANSVVAMAKVAKKSANNIDVIRR